MVCGYAVQQGVGSTRVLPHVSAYGARLLARGVRHKVEAVLGDCLAEMDVDQAGLDQRSQVRQVHLQDSVHLNQGDKHPAGDGNGPAGQAGAPAASGKGHPRLIAGSYYGGDLRGILRQDLSLIHISEPTRLGMISYAVFCLKKKKRKRSYTTRR